MTATMKRYAILAAFVALLLFVGYQSCRVAQEKRERYRVESAADQRVQAQVKRQAEQEARHKAELQSQQAVVVASDAAAQAAHAAAAGIKVRTDREIAALRASNRPAQEKIEELGAEVTARGQKIEALQVVVGQQVLEISARDGLIALMEKQAAEIRAQREKDHIEFQGVVAQNLQLADELRKRIVIYAGAGWSVNSKGESYPSLQAGIGIQIKRLR